MMPGATKMQELPPVSQEKMDSKRVSMGAWDWGEQEPVLPGGRWMAQ